VSVSPSVASGRIPKYRLHKGSGQAFVQVVGRRCYLGKWGTPQSKERYARFIAELAAKPAPAAPAKAPQAVAGLTIIELGAAYLDYASGYYQKHGRSTRTVDQVRLAIRAIRDLYGRTPAEHFGPLNLLAIQQSLVQNGASRGYVNKQIDQIKRMFKWGVSRQLVPASIYTALATVEGLRKGRTTAREPEPVGPVEEAVVEATLPHLPVVVADMVRFQRLTGCRPGEVCQLRPMDLDRNGDVWTYRPQSHKTEHRGRERLILVGPKAQAIIVSYLLRPADAYCFSPIDSEAKRHREQRSRRRTRVQPSQRNRRKAKPKRVPRDHYSRFSYAHAIRRALARANSTTGENALLPHWHPNQLRHAAATEIRRGFGLEAAQVVLGHSRADVTQVYAERDLRLAAEVVRRIG